MSKLKKLLWVFLLFLNGYGCGNGQKPESTAGAGKGESATPAKAQPSVTGENVSALEAALAQQRRAIYEPLSSLDGSRFLLPKRLWDAFPGTDQAKLVHIEIEQNAHQTAFALGQNLFKIKYVTLLREADLLKLVSQGLEKGGFLEAGFVPVRLPDKIVTDDGELAIAPEQTPEKPSAVTLTLKPKNHQAIELKKFLEAIPEAGALETLLPAVKGFELTRRHARKPGIRVTDNARVSLFLDRSPEDLEKWVSENGFVKAQRGQGLYERSRDGQEATAVIQGSDDGQWLHLQLHWSEPRVP